MHLSWPKENISAEQVVSQDEGCAKCADAVVTITVTDDTAVRISDGLGMGLLCEMLLCIGVTSFKSSVLFNKKKRQLDNEINAVFGLGRLLPATYLAYFH